MFLSDLNGIALLGYALLVLGLIGTVVPVVPGPVLIWLGAFVWAWGDGFLHIGWPTLAVLGLLALVAWASDFLLTTVSSRRAGASWRAIGGAIIGGFAGGLLLSGTPPILGTIVGALVGALGGMWLVESYVKQDRRAALAAVRSYLHSMLLAFVVEIVIAILMVAIFAWQALG